jgi:hypothetical protein
VATSFRPAEGTFGDRLFAKKARHPSMFDCWVRVRAGKLAGETRRWRYRWSAVDPVRSSDGGVILTNGQLALQLHVDPNSFGGSGGRIGEFTFSTVEQASQAEVRDGPALAQRLRSDAV